MFEETPLSSPHTMHTPNLWEGGDFMAQLERLSDQYQIDRMVSEGGPAVVEDGRKPPTHPLRKGRIRLDTALELVGTVVEKGQSKTDWSLFNSAREMDDVSDRDLTE